MRFGNCIAAVGVLALCGSLVAHAAGTADMVLTNGKIITVDDRFTIAEAVAIKGQRIVAVGRNDDIAKLAGEATKKIDLRGRAVIPGLIDNHSHWIRAAEHDELRLDGVTTRKEALKRLADRVAASKPREWIVTLGGWSEEQFTDDPHGFPRDELDRIAPNNPVILQAVYNHSYLNTAALKAAGIDSKTPDPRGGKIEKDANGEPTGVVRDVGGVAFVAAKVPLPDKEHWLANVRKLVAELNAMGITAWLDAGGRGMGDQHYGPYRELAERGELDARVFYTTIRQPATPQQVDKVLAEIPQQKPYSGNDVFGNVGWGESVYAPATSRLLARDYEVKAEDMQQVRRIVGALAQQGLFLDAHAELTNAINAYLDEYEAVNRVTPIKGLRWMFSHLDQVDNAQIERMKRLGIFAGLHSRPLIQGALMHRVHGDRAWDMPPFRRVQESGLHWGLGSDATAVTPSNPFYTLWFAVTGRMIGGKQVNRQTITREEALIAHTRSNAWFLFQESNVGSLQPGKYADLLVLDRDYLTVAPDEIKDIRPVMTMVGGKIVYQQGAQ